MSRVLHFSVILTLFCSVVGCRAETAMKSRLAKTLRNENFTLYTPLRTQDLPGSILVLAKGSDGRVTEFTVSRYDETFEGGDDVILDANPQVVDFVDELEEDFNFGASVGVELASVAVKPQLAMEYARSITMRFNDPKLHHRISLARLAELRSEMADSTREALKYLKDTNQLENAYLVMETVQVAGLDVVLTLKPEFTGSLDASQIKEIANLNAKVTSSTDSTVTVSSDQPILIGYRAVSFPDSMLRDQVSPGEVPEALVPAEQINSLKE